VKVAVRHQSQPAGAGAERRSRAQRQLVASFGPWRPVAARITAGVGDDSRPAVLGAGAMGTALAVHAAHNGGGSVLLATDQDEAAVDLWRRGLPHPPLRMPFYHYVG
jgi:hypothetical protein